MLTEHKFTFAKKKMSKYTDSHYFMFLKQHLTEDNWIRDDLLLNENKMEDKQEQQSKNEKK